MVEVSAEIGFVAEENNVELDLGLSIGGGGGGSFKRTEEKPRSDSETAGFEIQPNLLQQKKERECDEGEDCGGSSGGGGGFNVVGSVGSACSSSRGGCQPFLVQSNRDGVNTSSRCSSSIVLEQQSSSYQGGGSSDNTSNKPEQSASSHDKVEGRNNIVKEMPQKEVTSDNNNNNKPLSSNGPATETETKTTGRTGKPPKPLAPTDSSLPQMPYVSTTGNGPNGKTVNGFLYKYTKSEVRIVCVCHGNTFSPAEFVQHAGGTDVSHPLRHITVIPSAFE